MTDVPDKRQDRPSNRKWRKQPQHTCRPSSPSSENESREAAPKCVRTANAKATTLFWPKLFGECVLEK